MADEAVGADSAALVFVYGSLKRGQPHHDQLQGCAWEGMAEVQGLALYDLGPFPMAVACDEAGACLRGELYRVDGPQLCRLDRFEGAPRLYERQRWRLSDGRVAWVYVGRPHQVRHVRRLTSGWWPGRGLALAVGIALVAAAAGPTQAGELRQQCRSWASAHGQEQVQLGNRIGREQLLTQTHRLAEASADDTISLYNRADLQRLCRRQ